MCENLSMQSVPMLKRKTLTAKVNVALEETTAQELERLKRQYGVDTMEWIRGLIRQDLPKLKAKIGA